MTSNSTRPEEALVDRIFTEPDVPEDLLAALESLPASQMPGVIRHLALALGRNVAKSRELADAVDDLRERLEAVDA